MPTCTGPTAPGMICNEPTGASGMRGGSEVLVPPPPVPAGAFAVLVDLGLSVFLVVAVAEGLAFGSPLDSGSSWCATTPVPTPPTMLSARIRLLSAAS